MTLRKCISISILRVAISLLLLLPAMTADAQKLFRLEKDTIPLMRGFQVSFDLAGAAQMMLSDYGQYEAALRLNLHDQWFPIVEIGYGKANREDDPVTGLSYKTSAPYYRVGVDFNLLKQKHQSNRLFAGCRYAHTSYKIDIWHRDLVDPFWRWPTDYSIRDEQCKQSWLEFVFGLDAQIWGPLHLGWSVRYKQRLSHSEGGAGNSWYVPGYGTQDTSALGATFNFIIDI